jgi:hypothetical protein
MIIVKVIRAITMASLGASSSGAKKSNQENWPSELQSPSQTKYVHSTFPKYKTSGSNSQSNGR